MMRITRMDLDGKGKGSPEGLVAGILQIEKDLPIPVPIVELCKQLDIQAINELETDGFEGGLITDVAKSSGIILVNKHRPRQRQRFTIAHELGHFLIPTHTPGPEGRFLCSREDMHRLTAKDQDRRARMEVDANRFASLILIPPPALRKELGARSHADVRHVSELAAHFDVSKEAMARAYAGYHSDTIAILICKDGKLIRCYKNQLRFPFIQPTMGQLIPTGSLYHRTSRIAGNATELEECIPDIWINVDRGQRAPALSEQVFAQHNGYAMILLKLDIPDEDEEDEENYLRQRWHVGFHR